MTIPSGPGHVACIMDGNGRWASRRGLKRTDGHAAGEAAILATIDHAVAAGIPWLTLFAFSTENWSRPQDEVDFLMEFNRGVIERHGPSFHKRGIRIRYLGRTNPRIPTALAVDMEAIERRTEANANMTLTFAFDYGGRWEIAQAARALVAAGAAASQITEKRFADHLPFPDMPDVDLLIRTSGEYRISNFMLWRAAYAELVFLDVLWPDFRGPHLEQALQLYRSRTRRFGYIGLGQAVDRAIGTAGP
jgi:undecaprenyl diphosphate synthase